MDDAFEQANTSGDGVMDKDQFRAFVDKMDQLAVGRGLKHRETTDEFIEMCWTGFNGYNQAREGVTKEEIVYVLRYCTM